VSADNSGSERAGRRAAGCFSLLRPPPRQRCACRLPDGRSRPVPLHADGGPILQSHYSDTFAERHICARFGSPVNRTETFAVNVDTAESDLAPIDLEELRNHVCRAFLSSIKCRAGDCPDFPGTAAQRWSAKMGLSPLTRGLLYVPWATVCRHLCGLENGIIPGKR